MINLLKHFNGLNYLTLIQISHPVHHMARTSILWHQQLGHPSAAPLHNLSQLFSKIVFNSKHIYDICPLAKKTILSFISSSIKLVAPFNFIHCDVWGPHKFMNIMGLVFPNHFL